MRLSSQIPLLFVLVALYAFGENKGPASGEPGASAAVSGFVRLGDHLAALPFGEQRRLEVGNVTRDAFPCPPQIPPIVKTVNGAGEIVVMPERDLTSLDPSALGMYLEIHFEDPPNPASSRKRRMYQYWTRDELSRERVRIRPPGKPVARAVVNARAVFPATTRIETGLILLPQAPRFDCAMGFLQDWRVKEAHTVRFVVRVRVEGETAERTIIEDTVVRTKASEESQWRCRSLSLNDLAGQRCRFIFETSPVEGPDTPCITPPLWASPFVVDESPAPRSRPNLLLVSLDTLRPDHLGCYGYGRGTSPQIDRFAEECVRFETAIAPAPWTTPSHASLFTGLHPATHKAGIFSSGYSLEEHWTTLAELFRADGYRTAAVTEGVAIRGHVGFAQGFDSYSDGPSPDAPSERHCEETVANAREWLTKNGHLQHFLFLHTYEIHAPYAAPEAYRLRFSDRPDLFGAARMPENATTAEERRCAIDCYDAGIAYTDAVVGGFLNELRDSGSLDNTVVVVFSDHGEELWEHGVWGHTTHVYDELLRVLLLLRLPAQSGTAGVVSHQVGLHDVFATLVDYFDLPVASFGDSYSLRPLLGPGPAAYGRTQVCSQLLHWEKGLTNPDGMLVEWLIRSMREPGVKYIVSNRDWVLRRARHGKPQADPSPELAEEVYFLAADPEERRNVASEAPAQLDALRTGLNGFVRATGRLDDARHDPPSDLNAEDTEALRALGYL